MPLRPLRLLSVLRGEIWTPAYAGVTTEGWVAAPRYLRTRTEMAAPLHLPPNIPTANFGL